jgi:two-component system, OmpR family, phosphate regulon sensor histidine kinase PhoR
MKRNHIRVIVILGAIAIAGIIAVQFYYLQNVWSIKEKQFNQSVNIALRQVAEKLSEYNQTVLPYTNPVKQLSASYFVVDINSVIDANLLEFFLKTEFENHNIQTDYEYAIYDCHNDVMEYGRYIHADGSDKPVILTTDLPKHTEYMYYFGINFPSKQQYLGRDMTLWLTLSAILLVVVIFFGYSIYVILNQKRLSELQKEFINNMTHELKTPISSINISADVLSTDSIINQPDRLKKYTQVIKQENNRLNNLVEKVLEIARIEKGGFDLKKQEVDLHELILEISENMRIQKDKFSTVQIETHFTDAPVVVSTDPLHLTNIVYNLIDNAVKYAAGKPIIQIRTSLLRHKVLLQIQDNGLGIDPKYHKKVFDKFFRVPTGNVHNVKGFGLGLFYVKKVCDAHGWQINLTSEVSKGSTFTIEMHLS